MPDEERVKSMIRLAAYENGEGGKDLLIHRYSLRDYIVLGLVRTFLLTTVGYGLLLALVGFGNLTTIMDRLNSVDLRALLLWIVIGYAAVLILYLVISLAVSLKRYQEASRSVKAYDRELKHLESLQGRN